MRQIRQLQKSSLPVKSRYFLTTNQLFCFRFDIDKVILRRTNIHACTPTVYRDIHTFMHTCMNSYIKASPPIITSTTDKGENDFIHSIMISIAPPEVHYYSEALPTTVIDSVGVYMTKRYRKTYTVYIYTVYNIYYMLSVKDLPKDPGVAARMGFEPTTFRSKGFEPTNMPPRPKNIGNLKKTIK